MKLPLFLDNNLENILDAGRYVKDNGHFERTTITRYFTSIKSASNFFICMFLANYYKYKYSQIYICIYKRRNLAMKEHLSLHENMSTYLKIIFKFFYLYWVEANKK